MTQLPAVVEAHHVGEDAIALYSLQSRASWIQRHASKGYVK